MKMDRPWDTIVTRRSRGAILFFLNGRKDEDAAIHSLAKNVSLAGGEEGVKAFVRSFQAGVLARTYTWTPSDEKKRYRVVIAMFKKKYFSPGTVAHEATHIVEKLFGKRVVRIAPKEARSREAELLAARIGDLTEGIWKAGCKAYGRKP